jgi:4-diphosphocytidyl-2-C-methyl-D-erythritol kinase
MQSVAMTDEISVFAPAKLNLYLHVTGRKPDGFHELDSLVAFASVGDRVLLRPAERFSFALKGPQAAALAHEDAASNLVVRAAESFAELTGNPLDVALVLDKELPVASGIGGGSSDAAAALRALARHWNVALDDPRLVQAAARHGQDVPVCLQPQINVYMTADGVIPAPRLPRADIVMVNPNKGLPTPAVFKEFRGGGDAFSPLSRLMETPATVADLVVALRARGNDLYAPACRLMPEIAAIVAALDDTAGCLLARMSGSGATCFGLYNSAAAASTAAAQIKKARPDWWVEAGVINA